MAHAYSPPFAHWHTHLHRHAASAEMRDWLTDRHSLTARLVARSKQFEVRKLQQHAARCLADEFEMLGLRQRISVMERDVLLRCDGAPVVYAHTVLPLSANASHWPLFASLGNKSLGTTLFSDPLVERGALQFAQLHPAHPLMRRIADLGLLDEGVRRLYARRSLFTRHGSSLLVTEVFLPAIAALPAKKD